MNIRQLMLSLEYGNISREEYERELDILNSKLNSNKLNRGYPDYEKYKENKSTIYLSRLKGHFQIGLGKFITSISIIVAVILLIFGFIKSSQGLILISIGILFSGVFFGITITSLGRLVFYSSVRANIKIKSAIEEGVKLED